MPLKVGILAGEPSGDALGAGLMRALQSRCSNDQEPIQFMGVGGPHMQAQALQCFADIDSLAVNGFRDPILQLPRLVLLLRHLINEFVAADIDVFVGIDFNVFNFILEAALKRRGIKTIHYVSPSVYAWRAGRTKRVAKSADLLLCLYPFEPDFYLGLPVKAEFVGHPLADEISPGSVDGSARAAARVALEIEDEQTVLALLPGSRSGEVALMIEPFLAAAKLFSEAHPNTMVVIPCLRPALRARIEQALVGAPGLRVTLYDGHARRALIAADIALVKSGTSTLEAMLLRCPMVVGYRLGALSYQLAKRVVRTPYVALPNILAGRELVPELLQDAATGPALAKALEQQLHKARNSRDYAEAAVHLHAQLGQGADAKAAAAVLELLGHSP